MEEAFVLLPLFSLICTLLGGIDEGALLPREIKIACNHAGLTRFGGIVFFRDFLRVPQFRRRHGPERVTARLRSCVFARYVRI